LGGCSTPISALAQVEDGEVYFSGQILSPDGKQKAEIEKILPADRAHQLGRLAAGELLERGGQAIADSIRATQPAAAENAGTASATGPTAKD
jgi:hydroxymethylbilane synthase